MTTPTWQLQTPIDAILFDCDGTLSTIEGIDELARKNGVEDIVESLTAAAMGKLGMNPEVYQRRLDLVYPTQEQVLTLGHDYFAHKVPDLIEVIEVLKRFNKSIYIISAGLYPAVRIFAGLLKIPSQNIFAVPLEFDAQGLYLDFDRTSPLIHNDGKRNIVNQLKIQHPEMVYIGDGLNDLTVFDSVTRFIGYGGAFYRENIAAQCQYYISSSSISPVLPLVLTKDEFEKLTPAELALYHRGLSAIQEEKVKV